MPIWLACRKWLGAEWPAAFFLTAANIDFYGYAVNGIRQGVASSLLLLGMSLGGVLGWMGAICAVGVHASLLAPAISFRTCDGRKAS